ncbi:MAG: hypothetical protein IPJ34_26920 [Myxococcales bacterium]|nr:hypothetical protein [Myxococcales bacterium]
MEPKHYQASISDADVLDDDEPTLPMQRDALGRLDGDHERDASARVFRARRRQERRHRW